MAGNDIPTDPPRTTIATDELGRPVEPMNPVPSTAAVAENIEERVSSGGPVSWRVWGLIALGIVIAILLIAAFLGGGTPSPDQPATPPAASQPPPPPAGSVSP